MHVYTPFSRETIRDIHASTRGLSSPYSRMPRPLACAHAGGRIARSVGVHACCEVTMMSRLNVRAYMTCHHCASSPRVNGSL